MHTITRTMLIALLSHVLLLLVGLQPVFARNCERLLTPQLDDLRVTTPCPAYALPSVSGSKPSLTATSVINPTVGITTGSVIVPSTPATRHAEEMAVAGKFYAYLMGWAQTMLGHVMQPIMHVWPAMTLLAAQWLQRLFGAALGL